MTWINLGRAGSPGGGLFSLIARELGLPHTARAASRACLNLISTMGDLGGFISETDPLVDTHHDELWEAVDLGHVSIGSAFDTGYWLTHSGLDLAKNCGPAIRSQPSP